MTKQEAIRKANEFNLGNIQSNLVGEAVFLFVATGYRKGYGRGSEWGVEKYQLVDGNWKAVGVVE